MSEECKKPYKEMRNFDIKTFILKKTMRESIMRETMISNHVKLEKLRNFGQMESKIDQKDMVKSENVKKIRPFTKFYREMLKK